MRKLLLATFILLTANYCYSQQSEEEAIKQLLEKESATWRSGNIKAHAACWAIKPYSRIVFSTADGKAYDIPPETIINPPAGMMGRGGTSVNSNYKMSINGNSAWVSHDEVSTDAQGQKNYTYEFRMLEKTDGQWKLVGQSAHAYKP